MIKFLLGVIVGILIFFLFLYFGGGTTVKKLGEGLTDTGKKMEALEGTLQKEKVELGKDLEKEVKKKVLKEEKEIQKKGQ